MVKLEVVIDAGEPSMWHEHMYRLPLFRSECSHSRSGFSCLVWELSDAVYLEFGRWRVVWIPPCRLKVFVLPLQKSQRQQEPQQEINFDSVIHNMTSKDRFVTFVSGFPIVCALWLRSTSRSFSLASQLCASQWVHDHILMQERFWIDRMWFRYSRGDFEGLCPNR